MSGILFKLVSLGLLASTQVVATPVVPRAVAYTSPAASGGSQLDSAFGYSNSSGLGEPLNVIVSGLSTPSVLSDNGIGNWARSFSYSVSCLGIEAGGEQTANTGDGRGWTDEVAVFRYDYDNSIFGSCLETLTGGNHFRYWKQSTTGAYFLAVSHEEWLGESHTIEPNGYDIGRDELVSAATAGPTTFNGVTYTTTVTYVTGLLSAGANNINHDISIDGRVAVLTVTVQ